MSEDDGSQTGESSPQEAQKPVEDKAKVHDANVMLLNVNALSFSVSLVKFFTVQVSKVALIHSYAQCKDTQEVKNKTKPSRIQKEYQHFSQIFFFGGKSGFFFIFFGEKLHCIYAINFCKLQ